MNEVTAQLTSSRRKQQKPARKIEEKMPSNVTTNCPNSNTTSVIVRAVDLCSSSEQHNVDLPVGTVLGPFVVLKSNIDNDDCSKCSEGKDITVSLKSCSLNENSCREPEVIRISNTTSGANCEMFESDGSLFIRINRSVQKITELKANVGSLPRFHRSEENFSENGSPSTNSSISSISMVTSTNHDTLSFPTTSTTDVSFMSMPPHAIYFPVAFHDSALSHMQVVGYPQVIIPVALNRSTAHLYQPSLLVDETLSHGIQIPSSLNVGNTTIKVDKMNYPTTSRPETTTNVDSVVDLQQPKSKSSAHPPRTAPKRHSPPNDSKPLDLSTHIKQKRSTSAITKLDSSTTQNSTRELEKRYRCECGVSFNSETTLEGHRKYYCNSVANHAEINREPQKKALNRCQQCEFQPASANQLAQHIRANHSAIRAYVCRICGYKGYSQRGIRSHLRTHSQCSNSHHEDVIKMHVYVVTPELVKFECSECHKTFPTKQQMKEHNCEDNLNSEPL